MSDPAEPEGSSLYAESLLPLIRAAAVRYARDFRVLLAVLLARLVPFYLLLALFPVADSAMRVLVETLIAVPCIAALIRFVLAGLSGAEVSAADAVLGSTPSETLRLLGTNLLVVLMALFFAAGGPALFFVLAFGLSWATLVVDQVVVAEGEMLFTAIRRSFDLVRGAWRFSLAVLVVVSVPDVVSVALAAAMEPTAIRDLMQRAIVVVTLPFTVMCVTLLYHEHLLPTDAREDGAAA